VSEEGDPFTLLNAYDEWIKVKGARGEDSRKWCRRHGLEEQRLYEITRLKDQFGNLLKDAGLLREETVAQARNRVARSNPDRSWKRRQPSTLDPPPCTLNPQPSTLNPDRSWKRRLNPKSSTLDPQPWQVVEETAAAEASEGKGAEQEEKSPRDGGC
jgi:hypothetical protein